MEARLYGFGASTTPANKFDPTDEDIVAHYLLPRAAGVANQYERAVIDDDPYGCPPWELLRRHGHGGSGQAFFFVPPRETSGKAGRVSRVVGGVWRGQKGEDKALVIVRRDDDDDDSRGGGVAELTVRFRRNNLAYHRKGDRRSSGWVMHDYHVVHLELRPGSVVARIKRERRLREEDVVIARAAAALVPGPDQPGPSDYFVSESDYGHAAGNASAASQPSVVGDGEGFSNSYFSEGFGDNYSFNEGEGSSDNFIKTMQCPALRWLRTD